MAKSTSMSESVTSILKRTHKHTHVSPLYILALAEIPVACSVLSPPEELVHLVPIERAGMILVEILEHLGHPCDTSKMLSCFCQRQQLDRPKCLQSIGARSHRAGFPS
jgi:hypothetical protein